MTKNTPEHPAMHPQHPAELVDEVIHALKQMSRAGCRGFDCDPANLEKLKQWEKPLSCAAEMPDNGKIEPGHATLQDIRTDLGDCHCPRALHSSGKTRFGEEPNARTDLIRFLGTRHAKNEYRRFVRDQRCADPKAIT